MTFSSAEFFDLLRLVEGNVFRGPVQLFVQFTGGEELGREDWLGGEDILAAAFSVALLQRKCIGHLVLKDTKPLRGLKADSRLLIREKLYLV